MNSKFKKNIFKYWKKSYSASFFFFFHNITLAKKGLMK